ncbi:DNA polymerase III subunit epsilon [Pseudohongiella spirulinae]|uniref:DNA polymerase III subunit epsilon n=1 Tax=Pseudohongiella spirulinae TaxID=1249552 RepID=A0A0S2KDB6_9GAMM|nr:DNA polymerase III subunit epsilon [Pseudohongiella spirulinae]ALO46110.1 DNA polymerase III, epsilon subunit [Pseudohongiella spirulinae]
MRQIVLDTETTGLEASQGHRIIEIGCVELENRRLTGRHYHQYIRPDREIDEGAQQVHGISNEFLADKPDFAGIADEFLAFVSGAELLIHNAAFDIGFLDAELERLGSTYGSMSDYCQVTDTLALARRKHPGQRNSLDALCKRYEVDNSHRELHGALLDSEILADVYLLLTGGQTDLGLGADESSAHGERLTTQRVNRDGVQLFISRVSAEEELAHKKLLERINKSSGGGCLWLQEPTA